MCSVFEWFVLVLCFDAFGLIVLSDVPIQNQGRGLIDRKLAKAPPPRPPPPPPPPRVILLLAVPKWLFCFGSLVVLDVCGIPIFIVMLVIY